MFCADCCMAINPVSYSLELMLPIQDGYNALMKASEGGHAAVVDTLLRHNAQINLGDSVSRSCSGSLHALQLLQRRDNLGVWRLAVNLMIVLHVR